MEIPSPLPSVLRDSSPRTKRSISSSLDMLSGYRDVFRKMSSPCPPFSRRSTYTRVPGCAYLQILFIRLSITRQKCLPSAITYTGVSGFWISSVRSAAFSLCSNSPTICTTETPASSFSRCTARLPVEAFDASIRSSISFFSRFDWRSNTSRYPSAVSLESSSFSRRST